MSKLDDIRERWKRVTPGPWALDPAFWSPPGWGEAMHYRRVVHGEPNKISGIRQPLFSTNGAPDGSEQARQNHRDADAVAHAREDVPWLLAEIERAKTALQLILAQTNGECEHATSGIGSCFASGRTADAEYGADMACPPCIAHAALNNQPIAVHLTALLNEETP